MPRTTSVDTIPRPTTNGRARAAGAAPRELKSTKPILNPPAEKAGPASALWVHGRRAWQQQALARCQLLRARWATAHGDTSSGPSGVGAAHERFEALLQSAEDACSNPPTRHKLFGGITGVLVERVWSNVHAAEVVLVENLPQDRLLGVADWVADHVRESLPLKNLYSAQFKEPSGNGSRSLDARRMGSALQASYAASAEKHKKVRSFRNTIHTASIVCLLAVVGLVIMAWRVPSALPMCSVDGKACLLLGSTAPAAVHVLVAASVGAAAGIFAGITSLRRCRGTSTPYSVPTALWLLKGPTGALSAILGILLIRSGLIGEGIGPTTAAALVAWAVIFGAAQQLLTRLADERGRAVLSSVKGGTVDTTKTDDDPV